MDEGTVNVVAKFVAKEGREAELKAALTGLVAPTRKDPGYLAYDLYASTERPGEFVLVEAWESKTLLEAHLATPHLKEFLAAGPELLAQPGEIKLFAELPGL